MGFGVIGWGRDWMGGWVSLHKMEIEWEMGRGSDGCVAGLLGLLRPRSGLFGINASWRRGSLLVAGGLLEGGLVWVDGLHERGDGHELLGAVHEIRLQSCAIALHKSIRAYGVVVQTTRKSIPT